MEDQSVPVNPVLSYQRREKLMPTKIRYLIFILLISLFSSVVFADNSLNKCITLQEPFDKLSQLILASTVANPPQELLCHRAANASKHYNDERIVKAIAELEKFITEVENSLKHLSNEQAQLLIAEANEIIQFLKVGPTIGAVAGGVYFFSTNTPVVGATVNLTFSLSSNSYSTTTDENGFFKIEDLNPEGAFVIVANDGSGGTGSQQGSLLPTSLEPSILLYIDQPGQGKINGNVKRENLTLVSGALITAIFPETKRNYTAITNADGFYELNNLAFDGTVIIIAFDSETGASSSDTRIISDSMPSSIVDFTLQIPSTVNPELLNADFTDGLSGWDSSGPVQVIDRDLVFDLEDN